MQNQQALSIDIRVIHKRQYSFSFDSKQDFQMEYSASVWIFPTMEVQFSHWVLPVECVFSQLLLKQLLLEKVYDALQSMLYDVPFAFESLSLSSSFPLRVKS